MPRFQWRYRTGKKHHAATLGRSRGNQRVGAEWNSLIEGTATTLKGGLKN